MKYYLAVLLLILASCATVPVKPAILGRPHSAQSIETLQPRWQHFADGIDAVSIRLLSPRLEIWALRVQLDHPSIRIVMNDVERDGAGSIPSITVSSFVKKYDCMAAMNAGPFYPVSAKEGERRFLSGIFVSNGILAAPPVPRYDALVFYRDGSGAVLPQRTEYPWTGPELRWAVGGFSIILDNSKITAAPERTARHPRSAAGFSADGRTLYLLVIDGRRLLSIGATETETAALLAALGAASGINLDGGGSTALAVQKAGQPVLVNRPAHGIFGGERAVASCIGVRYSSGGK